MTTNDEGFFWYCQHERAAFPFEEFAFSEEGGIIHIPAEQNPHTITGEPLDGPWQVRRAAVRERGLSWPTRAMNALAAKIDGLTEKILTRRGKR